MYKNAAYVGPGFFVKQSKITAVRLKVEKKQLVV